VGGAAVTGGAVTGTVVAGTVAGGSLKITSEVGTVVAGPGAGAGAGAVTGTAEGAAVVAGVPARGAAPGVVTVGANATATVVVVVDEVSGTRPAGGACTPAARRSPTTMVAGALMEGPGVSWGRVASARGLLRVASRDVAATRSPTTAIPTTTTIAAFRRVADVVADHHVRSRSCACGRPNAVFLPMDGGKR
jgi:hypothetical protein